MGPSVYHQLGRQLLRTTTGYGQWICRTLARLAGFPFQSVQPWILLLPPDEVTAVCQRPPQGYAKANPQPGPSLGLLDTLQRSSKPACSALQPRNSRHVPSDFARECKRGPNPGNSSRRAHVVGKCGADLGHGQLRWIPCKP